MGEKISGGSSMDNTTISKHFYANRVNITMSFYDCEFALALTSPILSEDHNEVSGTNEIDGIFVHTSPTHAKGLFLALQKQIEYYEKLFGEIPIPPQNTPKKLVGN
jgi:hypothetical protein